MTESLDPEQQRKRIQRSRNRVLAGLLIGFAVLVYFISIAKMG